MSATFFRVDGADQESGQDTYLVLQASTQEEAEDFARSQGLLISAVRVALPEDWGGTAEDGTTEPHAAEEQTAVAEPPPAPPPQPARATPNKKSREKRAKAVVPAPAAAERHPAPAVSAPQHIASSPETQATYTSMSHRDTPSSIAPAIVLACCGSALTLGGVVALVLALWPDNVVRNDLAQLDYRLHAVNQTIVGSTLILSGLLVILVGLLYYLFPRGRNMS